MSSPFATPVGADGSTSESAHKQIDQAASVEISSLPLVDQESGREVNDSAEFPTASTEVMESSCTESMAAPTSSSMKLDHGHHCEANETTKALFMTLLNQDIRRMIYKLLLKSETTTVVPQKRVKVTGNPRDGTKILYTWIHRSSGISAAICRTSRDIAAESLAVLYGINVFEFRSFFDVRDLIYSMSTGMGSNVMLIQQLTIALTLHHQHAPGECPGRDGILNTTCDLVFAIECAGLSRLPKLWHLAIHFGRDDPNPCLQCNSFETELTTKASEVVSARVKLQLREEAVLQIDRFPRELVEYIVDSWKSGQEAVSKKNAMTSSY